MCWPPKRRGAMSPRHVPRGPADEVDRMLLAILSADGRIPYDQLADRTGISKSDTKDRIRRMLDDGTISSFTIEQGSWGASAVVHVSVESGRDTAEMSEKMMRVKGAHTVYEITGQYDIMVILTADNIPTINDSIDELRRASGVADTNTTIILRKAR